MNIYCAPLISIVSTSAGIGVLLLSDGRLSQKWLSLVLGVCAGIMLGASFFSLINPAIKMNSGTYGVMGWNVFWICAGALLMFGLHELIPHLHLDKDQNDTVWRATPTSHADAKSLRGAILIASAVALHNIPEGFAFGIASQTSEWFAMFWGIGLQNVPEGAIIALSVHAVSQNKKLAIGATLVAAMSEALAAWIGGVVGTSDQFIVKSSLLFCAGTMIYVVSQEMIPETHKDGSEGLATLALVIGVGFMLAMSGGS